MNTHSYAIDIEHILSRVFGFESRGGFAGLIDADSIESNAYVSISCALGYLYAKSNNQKQKEIEKFVEDYGYYLEFGLRGLMEFETNERIINGGSWSIDYENGEKAILAVIEALRILCD